MLSNGFFTQSHTESTIFSLEQQLKRSLWMALYNMQLWMSWLMKPQGIWNWAHITGAVLNPRSLLFCKNEYGNISIHCSMFIRNISILSSLEYSNICWSTQECEIVTGWKLCFWRMEDARSSISGASLNISGKYCCLERKMLGALEKRWMSGSGFSTQQGKIMYFKYSEWRKGLCSSVTFCSSIEE